MSAWVPFVVQGRVEGGELIRNTSDDSSISLNRSLLIMVVDFLTFSLQKVASIRICESNGNRWSPLADIIRGVFKIFKRIVLEFEMEFWSSNFFFLQNSWFRRGF